MEVSAVVGGKEVKNQFTYDAGDRIKLISMTSQKYNGKTVYMNTYDSYGNVASQKDLLNGVTYRYQYDLIDRLTGMDTTHGQTLRVAYDNKNRVSAIIEKVNGSGTKTEYVYGESAQLKRPGLIYGMKIDGTQRLSCVYDQFSRPSSRTLNLDNNKTFVTKYTYAEGLYPTMSTLLTESITNGKDKLLYGYDGVGNIIAVMENDVLKVMYGYDELNRLSREDNPQNNTTTCYEYDEGGNILAKK